MGNKKQGGSWYLRLWLGSDYFPVGQGGSPHHVYLLSVMPPTGTRLPPLGVAWSKAVIGKHLAWELFYKMGNKGRGGRLCGEDGIATLERERSICPSFPWVELLMGDLIVDSDIYLWDPRCRPG